MIVILLGPPGSGKGTQAKYLMAKMGLTHLSTGDMLRSAIAAGTQTGLKAKTLMDQGALVPDEVVIQLIAERSLDDDCKNGFILDGFPRNVAQAQALDKMLSSQGSIVDLAVFFAIDDASIVRRLSGRRTCVQCGAMYHLEHALPKAEGICDQCGSALEQREDDQPKVIENRLKIYHDQTAPLVSFYEAIGKLKTVDASLKSEAVSEFLIKTLSAR